MFIERMNLYVRAVEYVTLIDHAFELIISLRNHLAVISQVRSSNRINFALKN